jgi:hypothetical protein
MRSASILSGLILLALLLAPLGAQDKEPDRASANGKEVPEDVRTASFVVW